MFFLTVMIIYGYFVGVQRFLCYDSEKIVTLGGLNFLGQIFCLEMLFLLVVLLVRMERISLYLRTCLYQLEVLLSMKQFLLANLPHNGRFSLSLHLILFSPSTKHTFSLVKEVSLKITKNWRKPDTHYMNQRQMYSWNPHPYSSKLKERRKGAPKRQYPCAPSAENSTIRQLAGDNFILFRRK